MPYKNKEDQLACVRRWRQRHNYREDPIKQHERNKKYYWENPEARRHRAYQWQLANPEKVRASKKRYRDKKRGYPVTKGKKQSVIDKYLSGAAFT